MANTPLRVGVQESISDELIQRFPAEVLSRIQIVRIPLQPIEALDVDFWILPFSKKTALDALPHLRGLKVLHSLMAGVDWVIPWKPENSILCDGRGIHDISTSEWVLAAALSMVKRIPAHRDAQRLHDWRGQPGIGSTQIEPLAGTPHQANYYNILSEDLHGRHVLIVGYGSIGSAIERRLQPFGVTIDRIARTPKQNPEVHAISELYNLLPKADVVILIVPITPATTGLIGEKEIALMRPGTMLINAARGPVVVTDALVKALNDGHIQAAVDVTDPEPLPADHPLWDCPNCLITPHVAGSTPQFIKRAFDFIGLQLHRHLNGETLDNQVTEHGY